MLITVFTPTYNRAHLLPRLYESLCEQTFKDFEWVIVDDGSTDETREVVENFNFNVNGNGNIRPLAPSNLEGELKVGNGNNGNGNNDRHHENFNLNVNGNNGNENGNRHHENFNVNLNFNKGDDSNDKQINPHNLCNPCEIPEKSFPIRYIYKANGGKHTAINVGVKEAKGELFFIADSDDMLPVNALEDVAKMYEGIKCDNSFAGVCGLDGTFNGKVIGSGLPQNIMDESSLCIRMKYGVTGDMKEVFKTCVLKEFPFPEIENERFCPEVLLWNRIATKYKLRYFNKVIYLAEYQNDGITSGIVKARMRSPIASMMTYAEMTRYSNVPFMQKMKAAINYWRFRFCYNRNDNKTIKDTIWNKVPTINWYWIIAMPLGYAMHRRDINFNVNGNGN